MSDLDPKPVARPRWRLRLSLRALMILVVVIGLPLGWVARRAAIQRQSVAMVKLLGGSVTYVDEWTTTGPPRTHQPWGPAWLRRIVGDEPFQEVASVNIDLTKGKVKLDDDSLAVVTNFPELKLLAINNLEGDLRNGVKPAITEVGLARLGGLSQLTYLSLYGIRTSAAMMDLLPRWTALEDVVILDLEGVLPGSSLRPLGKLTHLQHLTVISIISSQPVDLAPLTRLQFLKRLFIRRSPTEDDGFGAFGKIASLESLNLKNTQLTTATLQELAKNPRLQQLSFDGSRLNRGDLQALTAFPRLNSLEVFLDKQGDSDHGNELIHRVPARFDDSDLDALQNVPLRHLMIMGMDATDAGVGRLLASHRFEFLTLSGQGITDASIPALAQQTGLNHLVLADTGITDSGLAQLATIPDLIALSLVDNAQITDAGVTALRTFPFLNYLTIRQPGLGPTTLDALRAARLKLGTFNMFQPPVEESR